MKYIISLIFGATLTYLGAQLLFQVFVFGFRIPADSLLVMGLLGTEAVCLGLRRLRTLYES